MNDSAFHPTETEDPASGSHRDPRIGCVLQDKYDISRLIGEGGMGRVYEARHRTTTRRVAVKFLSLAQQTNPRALQRFEREARAAGGLEHPSIAAVLDFGQTPEGDYYLVLEYLEGENCQKLLSREGALPVPRALNIVNQVCQGLAVAHEAGVVHRDLKPANLFVCARRGSHQEELVKILDFGIAKLQDTEPAFDDTPSSATLGTPRYMSPEQARGAKDIDTRSDIYSQGTILYELLSGQKAHAGNSPLEIIFNILNTRPAPLRSLNPDLPAKLVAVVERAMDPRPEARFQSALELEQALEEFSWTRASTAPVRSPRPFPVDATLADESTGDEPAGVAIETGRPSVPPEATPSATVLSEASPKPELGPWARAAALAVVAIAMGGLGGWLAARSAPNPPESPAATARPPSEAVPAPVQPAQTPPARERTALVSTAHQPTPTPAPTPLAQPPTQKPPSAQAPRSAKTPKPASKAAAATPATPNEPPAPKPASEPQAAPAPVPPRAPGGELWKPDEGWLDKQR